MLDSNSLSQSQFDAHHELGGVTTAGMQFGSWNEAVEAAGLEPNPAGGGGHRKYSDQELLAEIIRIHIEVGAEPSERKFASLGRFSLKPYKVRWSGFAQAKAAAYEMFGNQSVKKTNKS